MKRIIIACALSLAVAAPALAVLAPNTGAVTEGAVGGYTTNGVYIRSGPSTAYTAKGEGFVGNTACIWRYVDGQTIDGTPLWADHTNFTTGVDGYSSDHFMYQDYPTEHCYID